MDILKPPFQKPLPGVQLDHFHPLSKGLVGCWLMNEKSGSRITDLSGKGNHGKCVGHPKWGGSKFGGGLDFDGGDDYIELPSSVSNSLGGAGMVTISVWVRRDSINNRDSMLDLTIFATSSKVFFDIQADNTVRLGGRADASDNFQYKKTISTISDTDKHNIVGILDIANDNIYIYIDGILQSVTGTPSWTQTTFDANTGSKQTLGTGAGLTNFFDGLIDEIRIYNRALSPEEIKQLYNDPFCNLIKRRPLSGLYVPAGGGGTFTIDNADSDTIIENVVLELESGDLVVTDIDSSSTIENIVLEFEGGELVIADIDSLSQIDNIVLQFEGTFLIDDIDSGSSIDNISLMGTFIIGDIDSLSEIENIVLVLESGIFVIADLSNATTIENIVLYQDTGLSYNRQLLIDSIGGKIIELGSSTINTWNTAGRPTGKLGIIGLNTETTQLEIYNGSSWISIT